MLNKMEENQHAIECRTKFKKTFFFNDLDGILKRHIEEQETKTGGNPSYDG